MPVVDVVSFFDLMLVILRGGTRRSLRHFLIVGGPSQLSAACMDVAMMSRHSVAVLHVTLGTAAVILDTIVTNGLTRMRKDVTAGFLLGGGGRNGYTSRINAASWTTWRPRGVGLGVGTNFAQLCTARGMRPAVLHMPRRPPAPKEGMRLAVTTSLQWSMGVTERLRRTLLGTAAYLPSEAAEQLDRGAMHAEFEGGSFRLGRGGNDLCKEPLGHAALAAYMGSLTWQRYIRRCTVHKPMDLVMGPMGIGAGPRSASMQATPTSAFHSLITRSESRSAGRRFYGMASLLLQKLRKIVFSPSGDALRSATGGGTPQRRPPLLRMGTNVVAPIGQLAVDLTASTMGVWEADRSTLAG